MNEAQRTVIKESKLMAMVLLFFAIIFPFLSEYPYLKYSFLILLIFAPKENNAPNKGIVDLLIRKYPAYKYYFLGYMFFVAYWVWATLKASALSNLGETEVNSDFVWVIGGLIVPSIFAGQYYKYEVAGNEI